MIDLIYHLYLLPIVRSSGLGHVAWWLVLFVLFLFIWFNYTGAVSEIFPWHGQGEIMTHWSAISRYVKCLHDCFRSAFHHTYKWENRKSSQMLNINNNRCLSACSYRTRVSVNVTLNFFFWVSRFPQNKIQTNHQVRNIWKEKIQCINQQKWLEMRWYGSVRSCVKLSPHCMVTTATT